MSREPHGSEQRTVRQRAIACLRLTAPSTRTAELLGLAVTTLFLAVSFAFVLLYWFQQYGYAVGLYERFLFGGRVLDIVLGTNAFHSPSVWQAVSSALLAGFAVPLVGTFMVHRQQALIGETLAHAAFAGVAIGIVLNGLTGWSVPLEIVALVVAVGGALGLQWFTERTDSYGDVPLAIVLVGSFAVGTLLLSYSQGRLPLGVDIESFLFGSPAVVTVDGARVMALVTVTVGVTVALYYKQLLYITFDTPAARVAGLDVRGFNTLLIVLTAIVVVGAMQILGVILVAGLLVVPVAAASQLASSFRELLVCSVLFGEFSVAAGLFLALVLSLPSGGSIVTVAIGCYLLALVRSERPVQSTTAR